MNSKNGIVIFFLTSVFSLFIFCSCNPSTSNNKDTLVIAVSAEPKRLNPLFVSDSISHHISSLIFRGLTRLKDDLTIEGDLATHWEINDGGKEVIFYLRKDVLWHDEKPFTADDVVFTCMLLISKETTSPYSQRFALIKDIKAINSNTVLIRYKKPYGSILESWTIGILPKHIYNDLDVNTSESISHLVGNGPFRIQRWVSGQVIELSRNDFFYGVRPDYKSLIIRIIPDESTQMLEFKKGNVDALETSINQYNTLNLDNRYNLYKIGPSRWVFWGFNLKDETFSKPKFRQAMSYAIDKKTIMKMVYHDLAVLSNGPYPTNAWYYDKNAPMYDYNKEKSLELLKEIGFLKGKDGTLIRNSKRLSLEIYTNYENKENLKVAQLIKENLEEIGIDVKIKTYEWQTLRHRIIEDGMFQSIVLSRMYLFDPDISQLWHSRKTKKGGWNFLHYKDYKLDMLLDKGIQIIDKTARKRIYHEIHYRLAEEQACVFLFEIQGMVATQKNIKIIGTIGLSLFDNLEKWQKT